MLRNPGVKSCLFTGIYAIEKSMLQHIPAGRIETIVSTFIHRITERPSSVMGIVIDEGSWHDIGSVEEYERLKAEADSLEGQ
jgi:mannose-1-phosphate guanylyltransferase